MLAGEGNAASSTLHNHGPTKQQQPEQAGAMEATGRGMMASLVKEGTNWEERSLHR